VTPEETQTYKHAYYLAHRDVYAERSRAYRVANHEGTLKYARWYKSTHREQSRAYDAAHRLFEVEGKEG
jgi:hypothetical protein